MRINELSTVSLITCHSPMPADSPLVPLMSFYWVIARAAANPDVPSPHVEAKEGMTGQTELTSSWQCSNSVGYDAFPAQRKPQHGRGEIEYKKWNLRGMTWFS
jgi:hypothetical protein